MEMPNIFLPFHGVKETVNGEINIYDISTSRFKSQITDLDRLEKLASGEFQIAEHKSSHKLSLLDPDQLNEIIKLFFSEEPATGELRLKPGVSVALVYDAIESRLPTKMGPKKGRRKLSKLDRARRKYVQSLVNKARAISYVSKEGKVGQPRIELEVNPLGQYTGPTTESNPDILKSIIATVQVVVFRFVDEKKDKAIPISQHTEKNMQLLIALAQSVIDEAYPLLSLKLKFEREIKS